jgi:hypothetical protein
MIVAKPHKFLDCIMGCALQIASREIVKRLAAPVNHCSDLLFDTELCKGYASVTCAPLQFLSGLLRPSACQNGTNHVTTGC